MVPADTLRRIAGQLLAKSRKNQVAWVYDGKPAAPDALSGRTDEYVLRLPESQVRLRRYTSRMTPDVVSLRLCTADGVEVGSLESSEGDDDWDVLTNLFAEADRGRTGWDKIVHDIERAVAAEGPIGTR